MNKRNNRKQNKNKEINVSELYTKHKKPKLSKQNDEHQQHYISNNENDNQEDFGIRSILNNNRKIYFENNENECLEIILNGKKVTIIESTLNNNNTKTTKTRTFFDAKVAFDHALNKAEERFKNNFFIVEEKANEEKANKEKQNKEKSLGDSGSIFTNKTFCLSGVFTTTQIKIKKLF